MGDGEARADLDFSAIFGTGANEGADDSGGLGVSDVSSDGVVEDGENGLEQREGDDVSRGWPVYGVVFEDFKISRFRVFEFSRGTTQRT